MSCRRSRKGAASAVIATRCLLAFRAWRHKCCMRSGLFADRASAWLSDVGLSRCRRHGTTTMSGTTSLPTRRDTKHISLQPLARGA